MQNSQVRFKYMQEDVVIQCIRDEKMKVMIERYASKQQIKVEDFLFSFDGDAINQDLTFDQINSKDEEILIMVYPNDNRPNQESRIKNRIRIH